MLVSGCSCVTIFADVGEIGVNVFYAGGEEFAELGEGTREDGQADFRFQFESRTVGGFGLKLSGFTRLLID